MINNYEELQNYLLGLSYDLGGPSTNPDIILSNPGCSEERISFLKSKLPGLPKSYEKWIRNVNLNNVAIGYFIISPGSSGAQDMVESLIEGQHACPFENIMKDYKLFYIGSNNEHSIFVARDDSIFKDGEIILIDEDILRNPKNPRECDIQRLAKDFEQFLIIAGNLNQIHREIKEDNSNWEEKKAEFIERLKTLDVSAEYHPAWLSVF